MMTSGNTTSEDPITTQWFLGELEDWTRKTLPTLNNAVELCQVSSDKLVASFQPWITLLHKGLVIDLNTLDCNTARRLIQLLGFGISSIERHSQSRYAAPGSGLAQLPGIDNILSKLSQVARHPPRDSHYTYWLWNSGENPLTFTGDSQEKFFNQVVNETNQLHSASCTALRPICQGNLPLSSSETIAALRFAENNMLTLWQRFRSFLEKDASRNQRNMEPMFFMTRMRTYLPTYPVQGTVWEGVNAANLTSQMQVDYLIGTVNREYATIIEGRLRFLTAEDRLALQDDMALPSIANLLLTQLGLTADDVLKCDERWLTSHIAKQTAELRNVLWAYSGLVKAAAHLTAMHWALIQNYLVRPAATLTQEDRARLPVRPDAGTGGKTHAQTEAIMRMRKAHPVVGRLIADV